MGKVWHNGCWWDEASWNQYACDHEDGPRYRDRPDLTEVIMLAEELFGTDFPSGAENFQKKFQSSGDIVDWFEVRLLDREPNSEAAALLKKLAQSHNNPKLAEGLHDSWRREQIDAIVRELFGR